MALIHRLIVPGTRRRRLLQAALAVLYGQRGIQLSSRGSITSPDDLAVAWSPELRGQVAEMLSLLAPSASARASVMTRRVGTEGDGGYEVLDSQVNAVISAGTSGNDSFDLSLAELGARVLQVDNSQDAAPSTHERLRFVRGTVGTGDDQLDLPALVAIHAEVLGSTAASDSWLLKLDIEGSEWELIAHSLDLSMWDQIVVEFHEFGRMADAGFRDLCGTALTKLRESHVPVTLHGNSCCGFVTLGGIPVPQVLEVTFVHRRLLNLPPEPTDMDQGREGTFPWSQSNVPGRVDLWLWGLWPWTTNDLPAIGTQPDAVQP